MKRLYKKILSYFRKDNNDYDRWLKEYGEWYMEYEENTISVDLRNHYDNIQNLESKGATLYQIDKDTFIRIKDFAMFNLNAIDLSDKEKEIFNTLIQDGWYGTIDELINTSVKLAEDK